MREDRYQHQDGRSVRNIWQWFKGTIISMFQWATTNILEVKKIECFSKEIESVSKDVDEWYKIEPTKNITVTEIKILMNDLSSRGKNQRT